jgi:hypothetical protein
MGNYALGDGLRVAPTPDALIQIKFQFAAIMAAADQARAHHFEHRNRQGRVPVCVDLELMRGFARY